MIADHAAEARHLVRKRIEAVLAAIGERDPTLRAFVDIDPQAALDRADALDRLPCAQRGLLHGVPVAIKEVIEMSGRLCAWGSPLHAGRRATRTAELVQRLVAAGAVPVGITTSTEYALAAEAPTVHPHDAGRSPGASSSGSAAAIGAGLVPLALGTQTIGSIIRPAAYCGVVGFKPSHGRYPRDGILCLSAWLDHPGVLADSVQGATVADAVLASGTGAPHAGHPDVSTWPVLRIVEPWFDDPLDAALLDMLGCFHERAAGAGFTAGTFRVDANIALAEREVTDTLLTADVARRHGETLRASPDKVSPMLLAMLERGERVDEVGWAYARDMQIRFATRLNAALRPGEIALAPATTGIAPPLAEGSGSRAPQRLWTLAGMPTLSLPVGTLDGLPVGAQLIARTGEDRLLLAAAARLEAMLNGNLHHD